MGESLVWDWLDKLGILLGLVTGIVTLMIWVYLLRKEKKDNDLISISLEVCQKEYRATLPGKIRRKNLTRAELQGMLGMLPMNESGKRYQLATLNAPEFFEALEKAQVDREIGEVVVSCSDEEFGQFDGKLIEEVCRVKQCLHSERYPEEEGIKEQQ